MTQPPSASPTRGHHPHSLPRRTYRLRALGMGLGLLPVVAVLIELQAAWPAWAWTGLACVLWPHLAYQVASRSRDPFRAELRNLGIDSMLAGSLVPLMHFNILPSVVLLTVVTADKINTGVRGLVPRSMVAMLAGVLAGTLMAGFDLRPETSAKVMLTCLPILVIHTLAVSASSYQLIRKLQTQNVRLDELSKVDTLTGLESRGHWQDQVELLLAGHASATTRASMLLVDVDLFKDINDRHGHATGDDVLRGIAMVIRNALPPGSHAGRIGGDEFAVAIPVDGDQAHAVAMRIVNGVQALDFARIPPLHCSVSIGIAEPSAPGLGLRAWLEASDRALYRAKAAGRNRIAGTPIPSAAAATCAESA